VAAIVQFVEATGAAAATTLAQSITVTAGNWLHVIAWSDDTTITISDGSNTYTERGDVIEAAIPRRIRHFTAPITTGGALTVTATYGASVSNRQLVVIELSGITTYDAQGTATDTGNNPTTAASATLTTASGFGVAVCVDYQGGLPTVGTGYTSGGAIAGGGSLQGRIQFQTFTSSGSKSANFGNAGFNRTCTVFALFQTPVPAENAGALPSQMRTMPMIRGPR
jgi:hypothetical protein